MKRIVLSVGVIVLLIAGCNNPAKVETGIESSFSDEIPEPDSYFASALSHFNDGDFGATSESIEDAIFFLRTTGAYEDTLHADMLGYAIGELESLKADVDEESIKNASTLLTVFSTVDRILASYHLSVVETYFWDGSDSGEGIRRLEEALNAIIYAAKYKAYPLTEEEQELIDGVAFVLNEEERSSPETWEKTNTIVKRITKKLRGLKKPKKESTAS